MTPSLELPRLPRPRGRLLVALVLALVAVVASASLAVLRNGPDYAAEALAAARSDIPTLLSYRHQSVEQDLAAAVSVTTGTFTEDYQKLLDEVVLPTATAKEVDTTAAVDNLHVVSADRDRVIVLASLTQTTTSRGGAPSVLTSTVQVTFHNVDDEWLIAGLKPV